MKKKSTSKSKDRDKSKGDEPKSHKHSRRKRRSSSSSGSEDEPSEVQNDSAEDAKTKRASRKPDKDGENNAAGGARITRHSKRLAAISASSDDAKESTPELLSPAKAGKSSPYSSGSPSKESKKKDGTPDKHRAKEINVWKVESANGAGTLGKLKICRQRSPENTPITSESDGNMGTENEGICKVSEVGVNENNFYIEKDSIPLPIDEDVSSIQLPPADFSDDQTNSLPEEPNTLVEKAIEIIEESEKSDEGIETIYEIVSVELPSEPEPSSKQEVNVNSIQTDSESKAEPEHELIIIEQVNEVVKTEAPVSEVTAEAVSETVSPSVEPPVPEERVEPKPERPNASIFDPVEEESPPASVPVDADDSSQAATETEDSSQTATVTEEVSVVVVEMENDTEAATGMEKSSEAATVMEKDSSGAATVIEEDSEATTGMAEGSRAAVETEEDSQAAAETKESSLAAMEFEDGSQAELVLTVEENVMDEPGAIPMITESDDREPESKKTVEVEKVKPMFPTISQMEMEEVYDYEHDDTREEGELSANEAMSPIHEVFKKLPAEFRKRSWGTCNVFHFGRTNIIANEQILKNYNIKKRPVSKDDLDTSDPEDLIFVKEIREENIVHEIESETNNTSFNEKDNDESSPTRNVDKVEVRKKNTLESDKIKDKPSKRYANSSKSASGEGNTVLYITNLVRPFTVNQLRELLQRTGKIVDDGFWIDSIKSKCYVQFENEDQATETHHALHGIRWPVNNPKVLSVHFATQDELTAAQALTHESEIPRKTEPLVVANHNSDSVQKRSIDWKKHFEQYDERPRKIKDVREWDIGKPAHPDEMVYEPTDLKKEADAEVSGRSRRDKRRRNETSDDESRTKRNRKTASDTQPPAESKLLDDLFRRTKASPSIYWLPLSDEQIAVKQEARRKHLDDISRQMKRGIGGGERSDPRRRDRERRRSRR